MPEARVSGGFWAGRREVNARHALRHQWEQLEASGCINNFRLAAGEGQGFRSGFFFADSDAYKWLEAAALVSAEGADPSLAGRMDSFVDLLRRVQMPDGYLFTYNQLHFPGTRWHNLQVEHELYCHGHLIEAGVSHYLATGQKSLLEVARRAADRIVADFSGRGPAFTCGHEEIEIALLRLFQVFPDEKAYLDMAREFIARRGRIPAIGWVMLRQYLGTARRMKAVSRLRQAYYAANPQAPVFPLPSGNPAKQSPLTFLRWILSNLQGKYNQQHAPFGHQVEPVGHSVRFAYLETAAALLARQGGDRLLLPTLERAWERMVRRRMYLTGGIGSLPGMEGFGNDDELDPELSYAETCAALGCLFWNWEMVQLTGEARYSDLFEWQLYNAASVGMGLGGDTYLYNNPLTSRGSITRRAWYAVPCCPSNLSRTLAKLGKYIYTTDASSVTVHQYISSEMEANGEAKSSGLRLKMESDLPWQGRVRLTVLNAPDRNLDSAGALIRLRRPSWSPQLMVSLNGEALAIQQAGSLQEPHNQADRLAPAAGFDPTLSDFITLRQHWAVGDVLDLHFDMSIQVRSAPHRLRHQRGKAALTRGPLVYCLESCDNPGLDLFSLRLDPKSCSEVETPALLGGCVVIQAKTTRGEPLTFIPYFLWGNRGLSQMTVWVRLPAA